MVALKYQMDPITGVTLVTLTLALNDYKHTDPPPLMGVVLIMNVRVQVGLGTPCWMRSGGLSKLDNYPSYSLEGFIWNPGGKSTPLSPNPRSKQGVRFFDKYESYSLEGFIWNPTGVNRPR